MDLSSLTEIAIQAARAAGQVIRQHMETEVEVEHKAGAASYAAQVVTAADRASERVILAHLRPTCAAWDLALLSEETPDDGSRLEKAFFWCVDPLDGTLPFIRKQPGFAVSIALVARDGSPQLGVVYDPSTDTLYHATKGQGAFKGGLPWEIQHRHDHLTYVTDKPLRDTPRAAEIEQRLAEMVAQYGLTGVREVSGAGAVLCAIRVLEQGPACMFKFPKAEAGGGSLWDYAATACLYEELGLPATHFGGEPLDLNRRESTFMNQAGVFFANLPPRAG